MVCINCINSNLNYEKITNTGDVSTQLPSNWKEFVISITYDDSTISGHFVNGITFGDYMRFGFYGSSTDFLRCWFSLQNDVISIGNLSSDGNSVSKNNFTYEVFYR